MIRSLIVAMGLLACLGGLEACADETVRLGNVADPGPIQGDEAGAAAFSAKRAAAYMDSAALHWQKQRKCATCHTNMGYLFARPALQDHLADSGEVRKFYEDYVTTRWKDKLPSQGVYAVVVASALTINDLQTSGKLQPTTRKALDIMWRTQQPTGDWKWLLCGWPPMESDAHYGATLAAVAVGLAPDDYANSPEAREGVKKLKVYLKTNKPMSLHHRAMLAWASVRLEGLMTEAQRREVLEEVLEKQRPDGGWATPSLLADWKDFQRKDNLPHDEETSDGYGTGFALVIARELGVGAKDARLQRGVAWLKSNQRQSGKWFTRSPTKDSKHYLTNFGTAFAVLGLQACGELPGGKLGR